MKKTIIFLIWLITINFFSQKKDDTIRVEFFAGKSIPSYEIKTGKKPQLVLGLSYEHKNTDNSVEWQSILNNPTTGISLFYTNYGTKTKGNSISLVPFVEFHPLKTTKWSIRCGMGASYFSTKYHPIDNPTNTAISSNFTWAIQGILYYDTYLKNNFDLRFGLGVFHYSNGHTKLPNTGLNSALLSISSAFDFNRKKQPNKKLIFDKSSVKKYSNLFYGFRFGNGFHSFVDENSPVKSVHGVSFNGGTFYKNVVKIGLGINYRFYQHYFDYIETNETEPYIKNATWNASNIYLSIGTEVLLGQIGIDWEGGLNIHKPFYKKHYELQKSNSTSKYKLKQLFLGRLGLKFYAKNTKNKPKNNFYFAAHINSNLSQADFTELSIGFTHRIFKNN